jgi:hypothetical protein
MVAESTRRHGGFSPCRHDHDRRGPRDGFTPEVGDRAVLMNGGILVVFRTTQFFRGAALWPSSVHLRKVLWGKMCREAEIVRLPRKLISLPSPNPPGDTRTFADFVTATMRGPRRGLHGTDYPHPPSRRG